ncbi:FAD:protein FMN transferase [Persicobacter sp. CCB-QB2]|uniref:FAD:protein FMN transferase n=1 Tax=Persicobacter sp. CCB-QB2 TaxID=1561025 RepID=UPI0006A9FFC4|nr:FAD:protein FMN transferase [Persicobacter sp. CCB-QB2]
MSNQGNRPRFNTKSLIYPIVLLGLMFAVQQYRERKYGQDLAENASKLVYFEGNTMGTTYHIKYLDEGQRNYKQQVDSVLLDFNQALSTYIPDSEISQFNREQALKYKSPYFYPVLEASKEVYEITDGAFDPTIGPLAKAWGFGAGDRTTMSQAKVDSLLALLDFPSIVFDQEEVKKERPEVQLNVNALAKGYGVDVVADYLKAQGVEHLMVEIGGEVVCHGLSDKNMPWVIGIDEPLTSEELAERGVKRQLYAAIKVENQGMATSGNYRNYYVENGVKYAHTIDPKTGYPVQRSLLSATVLAPNCMLADAYATAFMVMGVEKSIAILESQPDLEGYLIYSDEEGKMKIYATKGAEKAMVNIR